MLNEPKIKASLDKELNISLGQSKTEKKWKNKTMLWSELLDRLNKPTVTQETVQDYHKMSKSKRDGIKDVGGFVGGFLKQGKRKADSVQSRSILTLDADTPSKDLWDDITILFDHAAAVYSTHSHTVDSPRLRVIIPLSRAVTAEEYQPLARKTAELFGMDNFDDTTYQPERLMFWPSHPIDGEYVFEYQDLPWLDPDEILNQYPDWRDSSYWPESSRGHSIRTGQAKKQGDPLEKSGVIGAFCRTYDIHQAIEAFLSDVYAPSDKEDRYTYLEGSTSGGLILYDDKFAYSHHGTDPVGDKLSNAFDLVRIHLFGDQDVEAKDGTPISKMPSMKAMKEFALEDKSVKGILVQDKMAEAKNDFDEYVEAGDWVEELELDQYGNIDSGAKNLEVIFKHDENIQGKCFVDKFANRLVVKQNLPWREVGEDRFWKDSDDAGLRVYIEKLYGISHRGKIEDAFSQEIERNATHPVREYLNELVWDNVERIESLLIDFLGAVDSEYTRLVTRKMLIAAVARIYVPGIKFDHMIVTSGPQGVGKTLLPTLLAGDWFSNSLEGVSGKDAYEALQGVWIMEMGEMTATKKADIEATKHFISKQEDSFRVAYGRHKSYFKRQCVFWGTSNDAEFLRDKTGNRRFWPVDVGIMPNKFTVWNDLTPDYRNQLWAEAKAYWEQGENLFLTVEQEELAREQQQLHTEESALEGMIQEYLEVLITEDWYTLSRDERKSFIQGQGDDLVERGTIKREKICVMEVWAELLNGDPKGLMPAKSAEIRTILNHLEDWQKHKTGTGKLSFGKDYGGQTAYTRI
ncbi:MAG: virulence-associated E family protein [Carnobacterium sp.]|uniref:virulence-associated E family protein n=1 Tax=Carnobacterium sp. TaxID=48221 RepID=UPI002FC9DCF2